MIEKHDQLQLLYGATLTPLSGEKYASLSEVSLLLDQLHDDDLGVSFIITHEEKQIEAIVEFLLRLVNTPRNLKGAFLTRQPINHLLECACQEINLSKAYCSSLHTVAAAWFNALSESPQDRRAKYLTVPYLEESTLARFHIDAIEEARVGYEPLPTLYSAYAYMLHKKIRINERQTAKTGTHHSYVRSARYFFKYASVTIKGKKDHPQQISEKYVESFLRGYDIDLTANYEGPLSENAVKYESMFKDLLAEKQIISKTHGVHGPSPEKDPRIRNVLIVDPPDGHIQVLKGDGSLPAILETVYKIDDVPEDENTPEEKEADSFEAENPMLTYNTPPTEDVTKKPSLSKRFEDLINLRSFHFYWDSNYLNLFHYSLLYMAINSLWKINSYYDSIIAFISILAHTGIAPRKLIDLRVASSRSHSGTPVLEKISQSHEIVIPSPITFTKPPVHRECKSTLATVRVPVPLPLDIMITHILSHQGSNVFSYINDEGKLERITLDNVMVFLQEHVNDAFRQYGIKITPIKIARSFLPMYHHRFGLDPIVCCYISGEDRYRLYSAQMHYIHIEHELLAKEYLGTFEIVNNSIISNLDYSLRTGFFEKPEEFGNSAPSPFMVSDKRDSTNQQDIPGYGSPLACRDDFIQSIVKRLKTAIHGETDILMRHNLYTAYTYFCLQFSTGLRPRNRPDLVWTDLDEISPSLAIRDKQSSLYQEQRCLVIPRVTAALLIGMKKGIPVLRRHIGAKLHPLFLKEPLEHIFFFVDSSTGRVADFTLRRLRDLLLDAGIEYELPLNMPRHYLKNHLYHSGLSNDLADLWMGHQHAGKEALNITSSTILADAFKCGIQEIEGMLRKLGFSTLQYLPEGWKRFFEV